jgi:hypothetical protein
MPLHGQGDHLAARQTRIVPRIPGGGGFLAADGAGPPRAREARGLGRCSRFALKAEIDAGSTAVDLIKLATQLDALAKLLQDNTTASLSLIEELRRIAL